MKNEVGIVDLLKFHIGKRLRSGMISHLITNYLDFPQRIQESNLHLNLKSKNISRERIY